MRFAPLVLAALCLVVLFLGLDRIGFMDVREARDAEVARELIRNREVLTPLLGTEKLLEKPVIAYAPEALAVYLGGGDPVASRRWRAALAVAILLLTITFGARHFGARTGWLAAGVLVTSLGLPLAARTDGTQLLGTLFGSVARVRRPAVRPRARAVAPPRRATRLSRQWLAWRRPVDPRGLRRGHGRELHGHRPAAPGGRGASACQGDGGHAGCVRRDLERRAQRLAR